MDGDQATIRVIEALESLGWPYMLVGSWSSNAFGIARSTQDADFVIAIGDQSIEPLAAALAPAILLDKQMRFETVTATALLRFDVPGAKYRIELFSLSDDPHDRERFARRRRVQIAGREAWVQAPEDVIVMKLRWSKQAVRPKDFNDAQGVAAVQGDQLDWPYIERWAKIHGTERLLRQVRDSLKDG